MVKTLFFLEEPEKIDQVILDSEKNTDQSVFISLSPSASYAFERSGIPYKSIRDYGGGEERHCQGLENLQRIDRIVTILDNELAHLHAVPTLTPARYSVFNLKILFDVLWNAIYLLKRIIDIEQPEYVRLYATPLTKSGNTVYAFSNEESVYAEILEMPGWNVPVEIIRKINPDIPDLGDAGRRKTLFSRLPAWIKERDLMFNLGLIGKRKGIIPAAKVFFYSITCWHRKPILIYNTGYNWDDALVELYREGMVPVYRIWDDTFNTINSLDTTYRDEVRKICSVHPGMREFDHVLGITISRFFFERLSQIVGRSIQESIAVYPFARQMITRKKIHCLLTSTLEHATGHALVQAAHDTGIPVISWQHGGAGYCYHPVMPFIEFINSDWHFVFGEGVARSYRSTSERVGLKKIPVFVPVGSSSLDFFYIRERRSAINQADKPVVYITTSYMRNIYLMSQPYDPVEGNEHIWDMQTHILNLAKKNPDKEFIIKLHPVHKDKEPLMTYLMDHEIHNVKLVTTEMTVRELTDIAGIVIFDLISTGILQVFTSDLPVFVYTRLHGIEPEIISQLKKRAYVHDNIGTLTAHIDEYIKTKGPAQGPVDFKNKDFLLEYGTDIHTHNSAEKAAIKLNEIISGYDRKGLGAGKNQQK
jgi:hypothetical protein